MKKPSTSKLEKVYFGNEAFTVLEGLIRKGKYSAVFVLTDTNTSRDCLPVLRGRIPSTPLTEITMPAGEIHKHIGTCSVLWQKLVELGADRHSLLLNLGGGVVTDLGGFVAATFKRGIDFVQIPTSLLAMVDAAIGGKTGVDLGPLKNQVGVIEAARAVCILPEFLNTLSERQLVNGSAEMYKHGLIASRSHWEGLKQFPLPTGIEWIQESARIKMKIVASDPSERGLRKILNFGHTLGHAVETHFLLKNSESAWLHGEAIACGMILEAFLSSRVLGLPERELDDITKTLLNRFPRIDIETTDKQSIIDFLTHDKKNINGQVRFVLLEHMAIPRWDCQVSLDQLHEAFSYYNDL